MPTNVTELVNTFVQNNPNANAQVKAGAATAAAMFSAAETGNFNISTVVNSLPPGAQANIRAAQANVAANVGGKGTSQTVTANSNLGPDSAKKASFTQGVNRAILDQPDVPTGAPTKQVKTNIPTLSSTDVRALMVQIAYIESNWDTKYTNPPWLGRYAVHEKTLKNYGYLSNTGTYLGKDGINSRVDFWFDNAVQDRIMERFILEQYPALIKVNAIRENDSKETVAGMLAVAYQFQDAPITLSGIGDIIGTIGSGISSIDTSSLVADATKLAGGLSTTLSAVAGSVARSTSVSSSTQSLNIASSDPATNANMQAVQSNIGKAQAVLSSFTGSDPMAAATFTTLVALGSALSAANKSKSNVGSNTTSSTSTIPANKQAGLPPSLTGMKDQSKINVAKVDVANLKAKTSDLSTSLPANKAAQWRKTGKEEDSRKRPGSLFFNAGRYAISTLAADVTKDSNTPTSKPTLVTI
jgi:hypothetical protein